MRGLVLLRKARGPGVKVRPQLRQRYTRTVSSFLARVPFGATFVLLQDGQSSGDLTPESGRVVLVARAVLAVRGMRNLIRGGIGDVIDLQRRPARKETGGR